MDYKQTFFAPSTNVVWRKQVLLLAATSISLALFCKPAIAAEDQPLPVGACPLNSGGSSLLGTEWRLLSIYGNEVPVNLEINMTVGEDAMSGFAGCNDYTTRFKRVGHTGFMITGSEKGQQGCQVLSTVVGAPTINVGDWEGGYLRTLQRAGSVQQEGATLKFYNRSGETSIVFAKKYGSL
ncbi:META domain-containing protein [Thiothrix nivea]|uniref:DUF306 domain-containing protein n=1 Tax=Thiothrix nivea (strain ATCC 35100 / DSM 5205 / JP2) TaxID=870187 RepID=A0A656HHK2_THINJ|nr:META domain-containing protein [Thiothrix nivea]EIJ34956.1 protein of unknown function DUF306 Meta and HslJ [Thiothrix nivea DSM 5205]